MLETLWMRNFQKHSKLKIDFDPFLTVLVGKSNIGKTSAIRCLRWLAMNRPSGTDFIRHGADYCYARLQVDGHEVLRERSGGHNAYSLDGHRYQSFGADVPSDIANLLNVGDVNFALQLEPHFWFAQTPGELARALNEIINLDLIDHALGNLAVDLRKAKAVVDVSRSRFQEARRRRNELSWVVEADADLQELERLEMTLVKEQETQQHWQAMLEEIKGLEASQQEEQEMLVEGESIIRLLDELLEKQEQHTELERLVGKIRGLETEIGQNEERLRELDGKLAEMMQGQCPVCGKEMG